MWGESALSQEEKDRLIKEPIKKEGDEQSLAAASNLQPPVHHNVQDAPTEQCAPGHGYAKMGEGESPMLPQEEKGGLDKARIRRERKEPNSVASSLRSSGHSTKSDSSSTLKTKKKKVHLKVEDDKKMRRSGKHRAMMPKASMRQSGWSGLYDNMIEEHLKYDEERDMHSTFTNCKIEEVDDVPAEEETERHRKSKHHSRDKKSSRRHKSDEKTEGKEKSRQRRRRATVSTEDGDDDDDLSRRIKEKLREREQEKKSRRRHRRHSLDSNRESCRSEISEVINTIGSSAASAATNCESNSSDSDEDIDEEIRKLLFRFIVVGTRYHEA